MIICTRIFLNNLLIISFGLLISLSLQAQDYGKNIPFCDAGQNLIEIPCGKQRSDTCFACGYCGDGIIDTVNGEQCDVARANSATGECRYCKVPNCGDGIHNEFDEAENPDWTCDTNDSSCRNDCTKCGDNKQNHSSEECDGTDVVAGGFCKPDCSISICGDGEVYEPAGETCEPGTDAECRTSDCAKCGDGTTQEAYEECDDGNSVDADYCTNSCTEAVCGDSIVGPGEECDDGNDVEDDLCKNDCKNPVCGDGIIHPGEVCDDGNRSNLDDCTNLCELPRCGDGVRSAGEQCDDGNLNNSDNCTNNCRRARCGDSIVQPGEQCDLGAGNGNPNRTFRVAGNEYSCRANCRRVPAEKECVWIAATSGYSINSNDPDSLISMYKKSRRQINHHQDVPSCFYNFFSSKCGIQVDQNLQNNRGERHSVAIFGKCSGAYDFPRFIGTGVKVQNPNAIGFFSWTGYMDKNCKVVRNLNDKQICGFAGTAASPISLLVQADIELSENQVVVPFSLDPDYPGYSIWKASGDAPLLVLDPHKEGVVHSAEQLFGNWTFGGKSKSYLHKTALNGNNSRQPWNHGYEALAVMDLNQDGKVSDEELQPISLWYDYNRNGVSEKGEVKDIRDEGFKSLYYQEVEPVDSSIDLQIVTGYDREVNGKIVTGSSVDWYGETFGNLSEAMHALTSIHSSESLLVDSLEVEKEQQLETVQEFLSSGQDTGQFMDFIPHKVNDLSNDVTGYWVWSMEDDQETKHPGVLMLKQHPDNSLTGYSVVEMQLEANDAELFSTIKVFPLKGQIVNEPTGLSMKLKVEDQESGSIAESEVNLSHDGKTLQGHTTQSFIINTEEGSSSTQLNYKWRAARVEQ